MAYQRCLPLPADRHIFNASTDELVSATVRASKLQTRLLEGDDQSIIYPKTSSRSINLSEGNGWNIVSLTLIAGGQYFLRIVDTRLVECWYIATGRLLGIIDFRAHSETIVYALPTVVLDDNGLPTLIVALYSCVITVIESQG
jgi:hypothetical protein